MRIADIMKEIRQSNADHGFEAAGKHLFCEKMLLVVSEIAEALEEFRDGRGLTEVYYRQQDGSCYPAQSNLTHIKPEGIPIEIADAVIRIFDWCEANGIDLEAAIRRKVEFNKTRPFKHGKVI